MTSAGDRWREVVTGYVLAGGRSSRMGSDKALLELGGMSLIERAARKLNEVVSEVRILGSKAEFGAFGDTVSDLRKDCGPLGALEAALADCRTEWLLLVPVDMPMVPVDLLRWWVGASVSAEGCRCAMLSAGGRLQPALLMIRREMALGVSRALDGGARKLDTSLHAVAQVVAKDLGRPLSEVFAVTRLDEAWIRGVGGLWPGRMGLRESDVSAWFTNVNTPEEFAAVVRSLEQLDELEH